jgi:hypothetical protein
MADKKFSQFTSGGNCQVGDIVVGLRTANNAQFTFPGTGIEDASGNFLFGYTSIGATAVNHVEFSNAATTLNPSISAAGSDTNVGLQISSKGTGSLLLNDIMVDYLNNLSGVVTAVFAGSTSGAATLKAQAVAGTPTLQLPNTSGTLALSSSIPALPLSLPNGGTGAALTANNGGIFYSNATTGAVLSGTATAGQVLRSGASSAPSWSTSTYPDTTTINGVLYAVAGNTVGQTSAVNSGVMVSSSAGVPVFSNTMTNGQVIIGSTGAQPQAAALTQGTGISITNGANSITIASTVTSTFSQVSVSVTSAQLLNIVGNSVLLLAAPGVNKSYLVTSVFVEYDYNSAAYASTGSNFFISYGNSGAAGAATAIPQVEFTATADRIFFAYPDTTFVTSVSGNITNQGLYLYSNNNMTTGDSPIVVHLTYQIITSTF